MKCFKVSSRYPQRQRQVHEEGDKALRGLGDACSDQRPLHRHLFVCLRPDWLDGDEAVLQFHRVSQKFISKWMRTNKKTAYIQEMFIYLHK